MNCFRLWRRSIGIILRNGNQLTRVFYDHLLFNRKSKRTNATNLAKQLWSVSSPPQNNAIIGLTIIAVFLAGIGIGDILSKSKQANTNCAAMVSRIAEAPP